MTSSFSLRFGDGCVVFMSFEFSCVFIAASPSICVFVACLFGVQFFFSATLQNVGDSVDIYLNCAQFSFCFA